MGKLYEYMITNKKCFYHITKVENISSILDNGGIFSYNKICENLLSAKCISSKVSRDREWELGLHKYVKLAYTPQYDMFAKALYDYDRERLAIIKISPEILLKKALKYTTKNSLITDCKLYSEQNCVFDNLDFNKIYEQRSRRNGGDEKYKDARQSEVLIPNYVETSYFLEILVPLDSDIDSDISKFSTSFPITKVDTKSIIHP